MLLHVKIAQLTITPALAARAAAPAHLAALQILPRLKVTNQFAAAVPFWLLPFDRFVLFVAYLLKHVFAVVRLVMHFTNRGRVLFKHSD